MPRVVQLSDLHLTAGGRARRTDVWAGFHRVLQALPDCEPFDRLVLTGDLANRASVATYRRLAAALAPYRDRLLPVPGNHDGRAALRAGFGDLLGARFGFATTLGRWRLVGLDSKRAWRVHGRLGVEQRAWLARELQADAPALLFLHHPVAPVGTWWLDKDVLRDRAALAALLTARAGSGRMHAVLCGHVHQEFAGAFAGGPFLTCPSTAYQFAAGSRWPGSIASREPAFRIVDLDGERFATRVVRLSARTSRDTSCAAPP